MFSEGELDDHMNAIAKMRTRQVSYGLFNKVKYRVLSFFSVILQPCHALLGRKMFFFFLSLFMDISHYLQLVN